MRAYRRDQVINIGHVKQDWVQIEWTASRLADMISGFLKYEYNYFGYIQGSFKLNDNPAAA